MNDVNVVGGIFAAIIAVAVLLLVIITRSGAKKTLNREWYEMQWRSIEAQFSDGVAGQSLAVMNADKLLDKAMQERRFKGTTMGERLKRHPQAFSDINAIWKAHKVRNRIAHDHQQIFESECKSAIYSLRQGLKDLGAIK